MQNTSFKELDILKQAIGARVNLTQDNLVADLDSLSKENNLKLKEFFASQPVLAEFLSILQQKETLKKAEFTQKITAFYSAHPDYKNEDTQKKFFNQVRTLLPQGSIVKVKGGYAVLDTEKRTGRSPKGTFPVLTDCVKDVIDFTHTKGSVTEEEFDFALKLMLDHMQNQTLYRSDRFVAQGELSIPVTTISTSPFITAFTLNMFRNDDGQAEKSKFAPWLILQCPSFLHPDQERFADGVFKFTNYKRHMIIIGGSGYSGEVKKGMFTVANHLLPEQGHLSFHCSSVYNPEQKDVTLIFGLSGTGKSTVGAGLEGGELLSDDETVLDLNTKTTFNLENGNYYKTGGLLYEPKVLRVLNNMGSHLALYENIVIDAHFNPIFTADPTANGRVSIPLASMPNAINGGMYPLPRKIIILSRDVNAVLDPINILSREQMVYYLALGYTSKTPGTEAGVTKPIPTYSKWEGGPFYDLKDSIIMKALLRFLREHPVEGVLLNSGEGGGPFGSKENNRFPVDVTLELARAFMKGVISKQRQDKPHTFEQNTLLATIRPKNIEGISQEINSFLNAQALWQKNGYADDYAREAASLFSEFKKHAQVSLGGYAGDSELDKVLASGPKV